MPDNNELPEGTDKIIAGASVTSAGGSGGGGTTGGGGAGGTGMAGDDGETLVVTETTVATIVPADSSSDASGGTDGSSGRGASSGRGDGGMIEKLLGGREKISGQAADKARDLVGQGIERSAEALGNVSRLIGDTATGLDERLGEEYGDYARRAASAIEDAANNIASKDADALIEDTRNFVRKSPTVALAGAAVVGFALARLVKSGLTGSEDDNDEDRGAGSGRSNRSSED